MSGAAEKQLEWTERASEDVLAIYTYIAQDNRKAAEAVVSHLISSAERVRYFPGLGRPGRRKGTRELVLTRYPYLLVYRVRARKSQLLRWPTSAGGFRSRSIELGMEAADTARSAGRQ